MSSPGGYLDYMGTSPVPAEVAAAATAALAVDATTAPHWGNPHSGHAAGLRSRAAIDQARREVLAFFGAAREYDVVFTAGCTSGLRAVAESFPWAATSRFVCHWACHTSAVGMREPALAAGAAYVRWGGGPLEAHLQDDANGRCGPALVVVPAECNFSGERFDFRTAAAAASTHGATLVLDAAAAAPRMRLRLDGSGVAACTCSFYKMFGWPTGVGALLVRRASTPLLFPAPARAYFGGGTVEAVSHDADYVARRPSLAQRLEAGTPNFHAIAAVAEGLRWLDARLDADAPRLHRLQRLLAIELGEMRHANGAPVVRLLRPEGTLPAERQGPTVAFVVVDDDGAPVGHSLVEQLAAVAHFAVRGGCFCNPGACERYLGLGGDDVRRLHEEAGHVCWDERDVVDGRATGAVRASLGFATTETEVRAFATFVYRSFARRAPAAAPPAGAADGALTVRSLAVYPLKGVFGAGCRLWPLTRSGLLFDREWLLVDRCTRQPVVPKGNMRLARLRAVIHPKANALEVRSGPESIFLGLFPDSDSPAARRLLAVCKVADAEPAPPVPCLQLPTGRLLEDDGRGHERATVRGKTLHGFDTYATAVDEWFSDALGQAVQLLRRAGSTAADADAGAAEERRGQTSTEDRSFSNGGALLVVTEASHAAVLSALPDEADRHGAAATTLDAYRANIVVAGPTAPFVENQWGGLHAVCAVSGAAVPLSSAGPCHRCTQLGVRRDGTLRPEPYRTLATLHRGTGGKAIFGELFDVPADAPAGLTAASCAVTAPSVGPVAPTVAACALLLCGAAALGDMDKRLRWGVLGLAAAAGLRATRLATAPPAAAVPHPPLSIRPRFEAVAVLRVGGTVEPCA